MDGRLWVAAENYFLQNLEIMMKKTMLLSTE